MSFVCNVIRDLFLEGQDKIQKLLPNIEDKVVKVKIL